MYDIGSSVLSARLQAGLTQRELADRAGMPQSVVARIESGRGNPTIGTIGRLVEAVGYRITLEFVTTPDEDAVVEAYKKDVDRTLLRENLKKTPDQRIRYMVELQQFGAEVRRATRKAKRGT